MVEVRRGGIGLLTSFIGERVDMSPMTEVWDPFEMSVSSLFGERIDEVPNTEVWEQVWGSVTSVFGDAGMNGLAGAAR